MLHYLAIYGDHEHELFLRETAPGVYEITLDGEKHTVDARQVGPGVYSLLIGHQAYEVELEGNGPLNLLVRDRVLQVDVLDERRRLMRKQAGPMHAQGPQVVTAPMPGKVVQLLVSEGDTVERDQGLVVVEAMKMQNELRSPRAGVVKKISVSKGAAVEAGAALVLVE